MNRLALFVLTLIGALVLIYTASFYAESDALALAITIAIAVAFAVGIAEIVRFDRRLRALVRDAGALETGASSDRAASEKRNEHGAALSLSELPLPLRDQIKGALGLAPPPALALTLTPYLVGLLVMLGLLGTFLGLFETLRGAHSALSTSQDITSLRDGLRAPMHGLMRSFGTSAAGVACSALLGLLAALARGSIGGIQRRMRELAEARFGEHAPGARQEIALERLAAQGEALPRAAESLGKLSEHLRGVDEALARSMTSVAEELVRANKEAFGSIREGLAAALEAGMQKLSTDLAAELSRERESLEVARGAFSARISELVGLFERQEERLGALESKREEEAVARHRALMEGIEALVSEIRESAVRGERHQRERAEALLAAIESSERARREQIEREVEALTRAAESSAKETMELMAESERARISRLDAVIQAMEARAEAELNRFGVHARELLAAIHEERAARTKEDAARHEAFLEAQAHRQGALEEALRARFEAMIAAQQERAASDREALVTLAESISADLRSDSERFLEKIAEGERARGEALGDVTGRLRTLVDEAQALVHAQREEASGMVERVAANFTALSERLASHFEADSRALFEAFRALRESSGKQLEELAAQYARVQREVSEGSKALLESIAEGRRGELEAISAIGARLEAMAQAQDARAKEILDGLGEARRSERDELTELKRALIEMLEEQAHSFGRDLSKHAEELAASLAGTERSIADASSALLALGTELGALVEGFSAAVDAHNEGAKSWREELGEVEALIIQGGEGAAAEALSVHLERTHELFDRQLRFQRELLGALRELTGRDEPSEEIGGETRAPSGEAVAQAAIHSEEPLIDALEQTSGGERERDARS